MAAATTSTNNSKLNPIILIGVLFFIFGFITWLNSVLDTLPETGLRAE
jgi:FHS family L-fucose permease-like MFS transporter